jgi:hypothetical protein
MCYQYRTTSKATDTTSLWQKSCDPSSRYENKAICRHISVVWKQRRWTS